MRDKITMDAASTHIRRCIAKYGYQSGRGHVSSALSSVEILTALYCSGLVDVKKIAANAPDRDRIIFSKAHAGLGQYAAMVECGILDEAELDGFCTIKGKLATHPEYGTVKGIETTGGSLGQGISFACGVAYALQLAGQSSRIYVVVGDGEMQEGSVWEALLFAAQFKLNNLTVIVDNNGEQICGRTDTVISMRPLKEKLESFGMAVTETDGHRTDLLLDALSAPAGDRPNAIIADTVKGKGFSFIEGHSGWHGKGLNQEQYEQAMEELEHG